MSEEQHTSPPPEPTQDQAPPEEAPVSPAVAFMQRHWRISAGVIIGGALAFFILPWFFFDMITVLGIQVMGTLAIYFGARALTGHLGQPPADRDPD